MHRNPEMTVPGSHIAEAEVLSEDAHVFQTDSLKSALSDIQERNPHRVVVIGGSYGGATTVVSLLSLFDQRSVLGQKQEDLEIKLKHGLEVTIIDERDGFFHTVGAPLAHVARQHIKSFWKPYRSLKVLDRPEVKVIHGSVKRVDPEANQVTYMEHGEDNEQLLSYDYIVAATGLRRDWPVVPRAAFYDDYSEHAHAYIDTIEKAKESGVAVIGGGAVGIEFAGEIKTHHPDIRVTLIHSRNELLSNEPLPQEFKHQALEVCREEGIEVLLGQRPTLKAMNDGMWKLIFKDGTETKAGFVFNGATKTYPSTGYLPPSTLDADGYVKVNPDMTISTLPNSQPYTHYSIGDITTHSPTTIRRAGSAIAMGRITALNIYTHILSLENPASSFTPRYQEFPQNVPPMMGLAIGRQAVGYAGPPPPPPKKTEDESNGNGNGNGGGSAAAAGNSGVTSGKDVLQKIFGDDLGWKATLRYLGLLDG